MFGYETKPANHYLKPKPNSEQVPNSISGKAGRTEKTEEKFEVGKGWFMKLKERSLLFNINVQDEAAAADTEYVATASGDLANIIHEGG